jgi:putative ABC transport system permease protein
MALGAKWDDLVRLVLWEGMRPVLLGAAAGVMAAVSLTSFMRALLYGVTATDATTFIDTFVVLMDPPTALRDD